MNEQLRHAFEAVQHLPEAAQSAIAARILEGIEEYEKLGEVNSLKNKSQTRL